MKGAIERSPLFVFRIVFGIVFGIIFGSDLPDACEVAAKTAAAKTRV
jgi:hypothetical protein